MEKDTLTALGKRFLIEVDIEDTTPKERSGILFIENKKAVIHTGTIVSVGRQVTLMPVLKKGDRVIFSPFHYDEVDEQRLVVVEECDVWLKL